MSYILKELIKNKLNQLTVDEFLSYAKQYNFNLSRNEVNKILTYLHNQPLDIFSKEDIIVLRHKIAEITNVETANQAMQLFKNIVASYGLESLFD